MLVVLLASAALAVLTVAIHLGVLDAVDRLVRRRAGLSRLRIAIAVVAAIVGHVLEILVFGVAFRLLSGQPRVGTLVGPDGDVTGWGDAIYYSAVTFTSLGYGDIVPRGPLRFLAAVEVLTGVVLVAWTASFLFLLMQRYGRGERPG